MLVERDARAVFPLRWCGRAVQLLFDEIFEECRAVLEGQFEVPVTDVVGAAAAAGTLFREDGIDLSGGDFMEFTNGAIDSESVEMLDGSDVFEAVLLVLLVLPDPHRFFDIVDDGRSAVAVRGQRCVVHPQLSFARQHV